MERNERTRKLLIMHVQKYPDLEIRDLLKFLHQSAFGCEHMITSAENATEGIKREYTPFLQNVENMIEPLDGMYSRIHLSYLHNGLRAETLGKLFFVSAKKEPYGFSDLENKLTVAKLLIKEGLFPFSLNEFEDSVEKWKKSGYPAVRHSESFRTHYHPSYRVISNEYVQHLSLFAKADAAFIAGHQFITIDADLSENRKIREIFRYLYDGKLTLSDATPDEKI